jgi:hypothetical protein
MRYGLHALLALPLLHIAAATQFEEGPVAHRPQVSNQVSVTLLAGLKVLRQHSVV